MARNAGDDGRSGHLSHSHQHPFLVKWINPWPAGERMRKNTMNLEKVMTLLRSRGLEGIAEPCLQFRTQPIQEQELSPGSSKFGGSPELPIEVPWPTWNGWSLDFLLQLDCSEIPTHLTNDLLPKTGWLYFFYDIESHTWGYDPSDRGSWRVLFFDGDRKALVRRRHPDYANARFNSCKLTFYEGIYLNWLPIIDDPELMSSLNHLELHENLIEAMTEISGHQILGNTQGIQSSYEQMQRRCQFVSHGLYMGGSGGPAFDKAKAKKLESGIKDWRLLLELGSDENSGFIWHDFGRLYFWIREDDLRKLDFDHVWALFECG